MANIEFQPIEDAESQPDWINRSPEYKHMRFGFSNQLNYATLDGWVEAQTWCENQFGERLLSWIHFSKSFWFFSKRHATQFERRWVMGFPDKTVETTEVVMLGSSEAVCLTYLPAVENNLNFRVRVVDRDGNQISETLHYAQVMAVREFERQKKVFG